MAGESEAGKDRGCRLDTLGILYYVAGGLAAAYATFFAISLLVEGAGYFAESVLGMSIPLLVIGALLVQCGRMLRLRRGRAFCLVMGGLCLPMLPPVGTLLGIYTLFLLTRRPVRELFDTPRKPDPWIMKSKTRVLAVAAIALPVASLATFKVLQLAAERRSEREADEKIVTKADELLLRLVSEDDALEARFGQFKGMERIPFYNDPWFTRTRLFDLDEIHFSRIARFSGGDLRVNVEIPYPADPGLGTRSVRIDSWRMLEAIDGATQKPITILEVRPVLSAPGAPPQSTGPRLE